jgi:hypothetical protein
MLKFADLTKSQKTFVVRTLELFPEYRSEKTLGAKQIHASYFKMKDERGSTGEKLGYPNWLQSNNRVGRGQYQMPWPSDSELSAFAQGSVKQPKVKAVKVVKTKKVHSTQDQDSMSRLQKIVEESPVYDEDVEDFNQILRENGIEV